jgi:5'-3' exonuclease
MSGTDALLDAFRITPRAQSVRLTRVKVDLIDGTYELFRHHYGLPSAVREAGSRTAATRGVLTTVVAMLEAGATHVGVATDHVIESFRNEMWPGYKSSLGMPEDLLAQFPLLEDALAAAGITVWAMVEQEADDGLAAAAALADVDKTVEQVRIHTVDKDLAQCVRDERVVQVNVRKKLVLGEAAVREKYGVFPPSIPDWLGLVGDSADGFPGLPGWGAKSTATVLRRYPHLEEIPKRGERWDVHVSGAKRLAVVLVEHMEEALLFRDLATLRTDADVGTVDAMRWRGPTPALAEICERLNAEALLRRYEAAAERLA